MELHLRLYIVLLGTICSSCLLTFECRLLNGYEFPVYTTKLCPRNKTQWNERSVALNCTESHGYVCIPNEHFTDLLEFCYFDSKMLIVKGLCMFLYKHPSAVDAYSCQSFVEGCPSSNYKFYEVHKYTSCVSIANGCFLAEPTCNRTSTESILSNSTVTTNNNQPLDNSSEDSNAWVWIVTSIGVLAIISIPVSLVCFRLKIKARWTEQPLSKIDTEGVNECNSLLKACEEGNWTSVQQLLNDGADIDALDKDKRSPLFLACQNGHDNIAQLLLQKGAAINTCNKDRTSPLFIACKNGHETTVDFLLKNGIDDYSYKEERARHVSTLIEHEHLQKSIADINLCRKTGASPLLIACQEGHDSIVELLLNKGADINLCTITDASPLFIACQNGHNSIVQLLLNRGAEINKRRKDGYSPLFVACQNGLDKIVERLIKDGADIDATRDDGASPLFISCKHGRANIVERLLENGAQTNLCTNSGVSPLYVACQEGHYSTVEILVKHKADVNLSTKNGSSPISIAYKNEHTDIVDLLQKFGTTSICEVFQNGHDNTVQPNRNKCSGVDLIRDIESNPLLSTTKNEDT